MSLTVYDEKQEQIIETLLFDLSESSRAVYREAIHQFIDFTVSRSETHPFQIPYDAVVAYKSYLSDNYEATTANKKLSAVRRFLEVAAVHGMLTPEEIIAVGSIKSVKKRGTPLREWLNTDQAKELFSTPDVTTMSGKRDRLILLFAMILGLRREEMTKVTWGQFTQVGGVWVIKNLVGKGNTLYTVEIPDKYAQMISDFGREADDKPILVAVDQYGNKRDKLAVESVNYVLKKYGVKPHMLRHTSGTLILESGGSVREAQQHLRHANQVTTEIYLHDFIELGKAPVNRIEL